MTSTTRLEDLTGRYALDPARTTIGFVARHRIGPEVRGRFDAYGGEVYLDGADPSCSRAELTIRSDSIQTQHRQRDGHLRRHFLDTAHHPLVTFSSTQVEQVEDDTFAVTGRLGVRGMSRPVTVTFGLADSERGPSGIASVTFRGTGVIDRRDWSVDWNSLIGKLVSPQVTLVLDVVLGAEHLSRGDAGPSRASHDGAP